ncbi:MAG TPA: FAD-binding oxidoreductase, partial [Gaiellaceae bacterium]
MTTTSHETFSLRWLRAELAGEVIGPSDPGYDEARAVFLPAVDRRPAAIVRPRNADEVVRVVSLARETGVELAVRNGGHSLAGHGVNEGGIVLDLAAMKRLEIDPESRVARAETGLTAGEVTAAAAAHGLAVAFGDAATVGIGGLTLGGGVGYLVRRHGLTIDSLVGAELVTADGERLHVDADHHPDLFWAIRGGGGNFGVATRFEYRLQPVDRVTGGMLILPATSETVAAFVAAADAAPDEVSTIANVMPAPPVPFVPADYHGRLVVLALLVHAGPVEDGERALTPFRAIATPIVDMLRPLRYPEMFPDLPEERPIAAGRTLFFDRVDRDVAEGILDALSASTAQAAMMQFRVLGGAVARVPADATAYAHRSSRIMANVIAVSPSVDELPVHEAWARDTAASLRQGDRGAYVNFMSDEGDERVHEAYPGETWDRLVAVKRR